MPREDANAGLALKLIDALRALRDRGAYPPTLAELAAAAPAVTAEQADRALAKKPFAAQVLRARKKDPASPVALAEDAGRLADSPRLAEYALRRVCGADRPLHAAARVAAQVDPALRPAFLAALERRAAAGTLPGSAGSVAMKDKLHLYLREFPPPPPKKHPAEELSERLLRALEERRGRGEGEYPLPLQRLVAEAAGGARPALVKQAVAREPFAGGTVLAVPGKADSPVALAGDAERLAASAVLLEYLLGTATAVRRPLATVAQLQERLAEGLRMPFAEAVRRRVAAGRLPEGVGASEGPQGAELFLKRLPPPAAMLAWKMLRALEVRRAGEGYPLALDQLARAADPAADAGVVGQALKEKVLKPHLLAALPGRPDTPVALAEDATRLADWPPLVEAALAAARTPENQAVAVKDLKKKVARPLQTPFGEALERRLSGRTLPASVGVLRIKRTPVLFLLADVNAEMPPPHPRPLSPEDGGEGRKTESQPLPPEPAEFGQQFDEAFARLDRERGGHNLVSLVALRQAIAVDRAAFDAGLRELRRQGRYSLSAAEGRHGISPEERDAGVFEDGSLLLFASRKGS
jgi:hypothetical protein